MISSASPPSLAWRTASSVAFLLAAATTPATAGVAYAGPSFTPLGFLSATDNRSAATAVSADGATVVGYVETESGDRHAFRWTSTDAMLELGGASDGRIFAYPNDVSADGSTIVGALNAPGGGASAAIWRAGGGVSALDAAGSGFVTGLATAVSADGAVVAGNGVRTLATGGQRSEAFVWSAPEGTRTLGVLGTSPSSQSFASDVSADGSTIVGSSGANFDFSAFAWTEPDGMHALLGSDAYSSASAISADGRYILGTTATGAFRWSDTTGLIDLGDFVPSAISDDGSIIVGTARDFSELGQTCAVIWDGVHGIRPLYDALQSDYGLDVNGWTLNEALDVSANGTVIVGSGINPAGHTEAFVAVIPEPTTLVLLMVAIVTTSSARSLRQPA